MAQEKGQTDSIWTREMIVHPSDLEVGNFVVRLDIPWIDTPFPLQGVLIDSESTKEWFEDHCEWVVIDFERSDTPPPRPRVNRPRESGKTEEPFRPSTDLRHPINALRGDRIDKDSVGVALRAYNLLDGQARQLIRGFAQKGTVEVKTAERVVAELAGYLQQNLAAMVWLTRIKERDDYTAQHSINSAILALGLAHALEWSPDQIERAGLAALLHDVGNVEIDTSILNKPDLLNEEEYRHVKTHTVKGYELLSKRDEVDEVVALAALEHHERTDGKGYPYGKQAADINPVSRLISIVDVYDAVTSQRSYRPARSHHDALGVLWRGRSHKFDRNMVETFIHFLGWVAPGTLVRLSNGELAIVEETNIVHGFYPVVRKLVQGAAGYRPGERVDLAELRDDDGNPLIHIEEVLPDGVPGINVKAMLVSVLD
ncbi:HD-GYP domain-containing protein [Wenzhouxiangella sediminis]|uniref:HD-GYP domain-containing protein n=1 Tax=Wenzhouxiangella sediminis TaxID=1792836 RepID=A0A3E1K9K5_9GAMM|nr:HD-GYP domain-containing protein [Wenzhouxiangella sediminis]RFF30828.1 HD-GYP domain-containing protein [Wenzhouxiangella sediminis]